MIEDMIKAMNEAETGTLCINPGIEEIIKASCMSLYDFCESVLRLEDIYANADPETWEIECDLEDNYSDEEIFLMAYMKENHCKIWEPCRKVWIDEEECK
jgi:hypothetical protein